MACGLLSSEIPARLSVVRVSFSLSCAASIEVFCMAETAISRSPQIGWADKPTSPSARLAGSYAAAFDSIGIVRAFATFGKLSSTMPSFIVAVAFSACTSAGSSITRMT